MPVDRNSFGEPDVMEVSRREFEKQLSCELARTICMYMVKHRAALNMELVSASCGYVATLCRNSQDCGAAAGNCEKAARANMRCPICNRVSPDRVCIGSVGFRRV